MASIQIPEDLDRMLEDAAHRAGLTKDELAHEILAVNLEEEDESLPLSAFSEVQLERMRRGVDQLKRGEVVTSEQVDKRFEAIFARLAAR